MPTGQRPVRREEQSGKPSILFDIDPQVPSCQWTFRAFSISAELGFSEPVSAHLYPSHFRFENGSEFASELEDGDDPAAYDTNLSYYHLVPFETDILD